MLWYRKLAAGCAMLLLFYACSISWTTGQQSASKYQFQNATICTLYRKILVLRYPQFQVRENCMMIRVRTLGGLLVIAIIIFFSLPPRNVESSRNQALQLINQSYAMSGHLNSFQRAYYLRTLLGNSVGIVSDDQYRQWALEMFYRSLEISDVHHRIPLEKTSLVYLSAVDPEMTMQLFSSVIEKEKPQPGLDGTYVEDVRANGATAIFMNYWNSKKVSASQRERLDQIEREALRLPRTGGEYPYVAIGSIIAALADAPSGELQKERTRIFTEALDFYEQEPQKFITRNRQFRQFLELTKNILNSDLLSQAAQVFVEKLLHGARDVRDFQAEIWTHKDNLPFVTSFMDDRRELLFEAFPTLQKLTSGLVDLSQKFPELQRFPELKNRGTGEVDFLAADYVQPGHEPSESQVLHSKALQASIAGQIRQVQENDPQFAMDLVSRLRDDVAHIEGYTALLPSVIKKSGSEEAQRIYRDERTRLQEIKDDDERLRATVALAEASYAVQDTRSLSDFLATGMEQGAVLFEEDSRLRPQLTPSERRGYRGVSELVTFGVEHSVTEVIDRIQQIQDTELKANLLAIEAKALKEAQSPK